MLDDVLRSNIGRVVAFILTPILLPVATAIAAWLQDVVGIDLTGQQLTGYVVAIAIGVALVIYRWLANRGEWERTTLELHKLLEAGRSEVDTAAALAPAPRSPAGLE